MTAGLCAAGHRWPAPHGQGVSRRPRGWAQLGGRSPGLRLAAAVFRPWKATQCNLRSLLRQGPRASALPMCPTWVPALTPAPSDWASPRKDGKHKLQRPAARRPGERRARFTPPPLETQRPWGAQQPLRVGCSTQPKDKNPGQKTDCFFGKAIRKQRAGFVAQLSTRVSEPREGSVALDQPPFMTRE